MPKKQALKSRILDEKDQKILMILQDDGRESLTNIAKNVGLSIDSVFNRVKELQKKGVFTAGIFIDPRVIGFQLIIDVRIKLHNITPEMKDRFIKHLISHNRVTNLFSITGKYDFLCTIIAKETKELEEIITAIRNKYKDYTQDWETTLFLKTYKLERYDLVNDTD